MIVIRDRSQRTSPSEGGEGVCKKWHRVTGGGEGVPSKWRHKEELEDLDLYDGEEEELSEEQAGAETGEQAEVRQVAPSSNIFDKLNHIFNLS